MLRLLSMRLTAAGYQVTAVTSAESALTQLEIEHPAAGAERRAPARAATAWQLFDEIRKRHPALPVILLTAHGTIPDAVEATARGVFTYLTKPYDGAELLDKIAQALALGAPARQRRQGGDESWRAEIVSRSNRMAELLAEARMVAKSDASVLLRGDSGAGKELLARAIHRASARADKPFVAVNCGAIPEALLESELFGHMKGAFTDAVANHKGLFQQADGGTLLLDEIGDMPPALQVKLLRVLQERAVRPVGVDASRSRSTCGSSPPPTATSMPRWRPGQFREDLYYRLNVVTLHAAAAGGAARGHSAAGQPLPAAGCRASTASACRASRPEALKALTTASWPGNVRQLFNVVEQVCALSSSPLIPLALVQRALRVAQRRGPDLCRGQAALRARIPGRPAQADRRQRGRRGTPGRPQPHRVLSPAAEARAHARALQVRCRVAGRRCCRRRATTLSA